MQAHAAAHTQGQHGKHEYDLASFGLSREQVRERFADYVGRFGL